jgi:hypothetical protein
MSNDFVTSALKRSMVANGNLHLVAKKTFDLVPKIIKTFDLVPKKDLI